MDEDCFESDWCDFHNGHNQSEDDVNHDQMLHFTHEIETQQDNESTNNNKMKWHEATDHENVMISLDGANDLIWKLGLEEVKDCIERLPGALEATDEEVRNNESSSVLECFMGEHSSLAQVARATRKTSCLEWLKCLLVCNSQKTCGLPRAELHSDE